MCGGGRVDFCPKTLRGRTGSVPSVGGGFREGRHTGQWDCKQTGETSECFDGNLLFSLLLRNLEQTTEHAAKVTCKVQTTTSCLQQQQQWQSPLPGLQHVNNNNNANKAVIDCRLHSWCRIMTNSTKHCSCLTSKWYSSATWRTSSKDNVFRDSAYWSHGMKTWRHLYDQNYTTCHNTIRGGPIHGHRHMHKKIWWSSATWFSSYASGQTDRHTNRHTHHKFTILCKLTGAK